MNAEQHLTQKGIRVTAMRQLVFDYLSSQDVAVTLSDIENAFAKADRTTLYRTIKTFEEKGVVHSIDDGTGTHKYALCEAKCDGHHHQDLHLHFHCTKCNETICLTDTQIPSIKVPKGFVAEDINLVIKGICDKCSKL